MERKRITCPETAHLEEIEYERTPFGLVLHSCTRFDPACAVRCEGECARRMDRKERRDAGDLRERVLIVYADGPRMRRFADELSRALEADGFVVERGNADTHAVAPPDDYDAVVIGSPLRFGRYPRAIASYVRDYRAALAERPSFLYFVNRTGFANAGVLRRETGWWPTRAFGIARARWASRLLGVPQAPDARIGELALAIADEMPNAIAI